MNSKATPGLVSIIVASYNHAEYLERRMDSLIAQTYPDIEIIVIDDCSPDNSLEILRKYESHPKVKLFIREKNGGWVTVSNQGVALSSGEFIIFANCDDDCEPQCIERLVESMHAYPSAGIAFTRSLLIDRDGSLIGNDYLIRESAFRRRCTHDTLLSKNEMLRFLLWSCVIPNLSAALFRKECFTAFSGLSAEYKVCSDWDLFLKIISSFDVAYVATPLNKFRQHNTTIRSSTKDRIIYEEYIRLLLGQIKSFDLTLFEKSKFRMRVMYLWSIHLLTPSFGGVLNFQYHFLRVLHHDAVALIYLPAALVLRLMGLMARAPVKLLRNKISLI